MEGARLVALGLLAGLWLVPSRGVGQEVPAAEEAGVHGMAAAAVTARGTPAAAEFAVNASTLGPQTQPAVAAQASGGFVVVWTHETAAGPLRRDVHARLFDDTGAPLGGEFLVSGASGGLDEDPAVSSDGAGDLVVVWRHAASAGDSGILGRRFDAGGAPLGGEFSVGGAGQYVRYPSVAHDGAGRFVVAWTVREPDGPATDVFARRFDSAGVPLGGEFRVNSYTTGYQQRASVAADAAGRFLVVWHSGEFAPIGRLERAAAAAGRPSRGDAGRRPRQDGSSFGIFAQRYDAAGVPLGGEFQVNEATAGVQSGPAVSTDAQGRAVVVWMSEAAPGVRDTEIRGRRFAADGSALGGEFQAHNPHAGLQLYPAVDHDAAGRFAVVWNDCSGLDGSGCGVFGRHFDASGAPRGLEFPVNAWTTGDQARAALAVEPDGDFVVAWQDGGYSLQEGDGRDGSGAGIYARALPEGAFSAVPAIGVVALGLLGPAAATLRAARGRRRSRR